ncbi:MAG: hypothetical protein ACK5XF_05730, partial [Neisseriaceae bacterium]
ILYYIIFPIHNHRRYINLLYNEIAHKFGEFACALEICNDNSIDDNVKILVDTVCEISLRV